MGPISYKAYKAPPGLLNIGIFNFVLRKYITFLGEIPESPQKNVGTAQYHERKIYLVYLNAADLVLDSTQP